MYYECLHDIEDMLALCGPEYEVGAHVRVLAPGSQIDPIKATVISILPPVGKDVDTAYRCHIDGSSFTVPAYTVGDGKTRWVIV